MISNTIITAHSGCDSTPDNSIDFVTYACSLEVECFEVDVRRNEQGTLVIAHDETDPAVELSHVFALLAAAPGKRVNCDLKLPGLELEVYRLAQQFGVEGRLIYSGTVSFDVVKANPWLMETVAWFLNIELILPELKHLEAEETRRALSDEAKSKEMARTVKQTLSCCRAPCLNLWYGLYDTALGEALIAQQIPLSVWTPSTPELLDIFLSRQVYNITTRSAQLACEKRKTLQGLAEGENA